MKVTIGNNEFKVKLCVTPEAIKNGMMGKRINDEFNGMFFILPYKGEPSFWMMNCIIPLDIIMIDGNTKYSCTNNYYSLHAFSFLFTLYWVSL